MAATSTDDQVPTPGDGTCASKQEDSEIRCPGRKADGFEHCLAHLEPAQLDQFLQGLRPRADLDASGTPINAELLAQILQALRDKTVRDKTERPVFGDVSFADAQFTEGASFIGVQFAGEATFDGAQFSGNAYFINAQFTGKARFERPQFTGSAIFHDAQFKGDARFNGAQFSGIASFNRAQFAGETNFIGAQFTGETSFHDAKFTENAVFHRAEFAGEASFSGAQFAGEAFFSGARFPTAGFLGPLMARTLNLDEAVFDRPLVIEVAATRVSCVGTIWKAGVTLRLRYARVDLERATLTQPSFITGSDKRFVGLFGVDESHLARGHVPNEPADSPEPWIPHLLTLRGVDAANLSVTDVDLSRCRFAGALLLDQLRLEGRCVFDHPPPGIRTGWAWPPVWRWSRRQSLVEERNWRATTRKYAGWSDTPQHPRVREALLWGSGGSIPEHEAAEEIRAITIESFKVGPERLAALYRQLRKAQEDAKNEPGAADLYYGEMEMRRHARSSPWAERLLLAAYWAVSGYGLRATRAFIALAVLIAGSAAVLQYAGFPGHTPAYLDSLLYAAGSVLSLSLTIGHLPAVLTHWGDVIRMLLRIAGPVLLGLAALALRGRVKR